MSPVTTRLVLAVSVCFFTVVTEGEPRRRALLVGINDYSAGKKTRDGARTERELPNLDGATNDVTLMREILVTVFQFQSSEIVTLRNREATRASILGKINSHLLDGARSGDVLLFYFSGHGSQVANSLSEEEDRMDETIVPADARSGADDIRDKELRRRFLPVLERGARLTIILDSCHSGSGVRGLPGGGKPRYVLPDTRDVKDGYRGPTLEDRGALILSATRDTGIAFEIRVEKNEFRGAFSWAWARAVRDAAREEPAAAIFQRAAARMSVERPDQVPVIAGTAEVRLAPFLDVRKDRSSERVTVAVRSIDANGEVMIHGGWANGLTRGSELRPVTEKPSETRLEVIAFDGLQGCTARVRKGSAKSLHTGSLLELVAWAPPPGTPLRIWVPEGEARVAVAARKLANAAKTAGLSWIEDPTSEPPDLIIRWNGSKWESLDGNRRVTTFNAADVQLAESRRGTSIFVQLPASPAIARVASRDGVERVKGPREADYILTGRLRDDRIEYAWIRPSVDERDRHQGTLPLRSDWHDGTDASRAAKLLADDLSRLRRIHFWQTLPSPPETSFHYRLGIRRASDGALVTDGTMRADERYGFVMLPRTEADEVVPPRFVYVFMVDTYGKSVLFYPRSPIGSLENRFPTSRSTFSEIRLGAEDALRVVAPFGTDTYFLLSTDEPLLTPWTLEWDGIRTREVRGRTTFEGLLRQMMSGDRGVILPGSTRWSIERVPFRSMPATQAAAASFARSR